VWCVDPSNVTYAVRQTVTGYVHPQSGLFSFDSQLRYSCEAGRRFEDGLTSRLIVCDVNAAWNDSAFTCDCTLPLPLVLHWSVVTCSTGTPCQCYWRDTSGFSVRTGSCLLLHPTSFCESDRLVSLWPVGLHDAMPAHFIGTKKIKIKYSNPVLWAIVDCC